MTYLLDSDHLSILMRPGGAEYARLRSRISMRNSTEFALSIVGFHEQALGCHNFVNRARHPREILRGYEMLSSLLNLYAPSQVLAFDAAAQSQFEQLRHQQIRVKAMDLRIAATAMVHGLILLTRNVNDFSRIAGLTIEDWTAP